MATAQKTKSKGALRPVTEAKEPVSRKALPPAWLLSNAVIMALLAEKTKLVEVKGSMTIPAGKEWKGIPEGDTRKLPRDGHLRLQTAVEARNAGRDGALLKEDSDLFDYESFSCFQLAVSGCKNVPVLEAVAKTLIGGKIDLDAAAEAGKAERNKPSDLRFLKELVYCAGTLKHLSEVSQHNQIQYLGALEKFQQRIANLRYSKVKTWDENGKPADGARVPRMENAPKQAAPTILGFRLGTVIGAAVEKLVAAGKKGMTIAAFEEAAKGGQSNTIARAVDRGAFRVEKNGKDKRGEWMLYAVLG